MGHNFILLKLCNRLANHNQIRYNETNRENKNEHTQKLRVNSKGDNNHGQKTSSFDDSGRLRLKS
jgi:hypothetical protein